MAVDPYPLTDAEIEEAKGRRPDPDIDLDHYVMAGAKKQKKDYWPIVILIALVVILAIGGLWATKTYKVGLFKEMPEIKVIEGKPLPDDTVKVSFKPKLELPRYYEADLMLKDAVNIKLVFHALPEKLVLLDEQQILEIRYKLREVVAEVTTNEIIGHRRAEVFEKSYEVFREYGIEIFDMETILPARVVQHLNMVMAARQELELIKAKAKAEELRAEAMLKKAEVDRRKEEEDHKMRLLRIENLAREQNLKQKLGVKE